MFHSDFPIKSSNEDLLDRSPFAVNLARSILNMPKGQSYCIGLLGKWGSGKSSIINILIDEFAASGLSNNEAPIVVKFEPWNFTNTENLLGQFFISLRNAYSNTGDTKLKRISDAIERYSGAFDLDTIANLGGRFAPVIKLALALMGHKFSSDSTEMDISKQKENVVSLMEKENRKTIIIIDDIDRLSNEQIRQVFQLVTAVARFPNTVYILSFDRSVVARALEKVQDCNGEEYLEKIIQIPIQIPDIKRFKMERVLFDELNRVLNEFPEINFDKQYWNEVYRFCVFPFIKTIRDVKRLCNILAFKMSYVASEVNPVDMIAISALEISNPRVFAWVTENKELLTGTFSWDSLGASKKSTAEKEKEYSEILSHLVTPEGPYTQKNVKTILKALSAVFPHFGREIGLSQRELNKDTLRRRNRVAHEDKFDRYFILDINDIAIRDADISLAIKCWSKEDLVAFFDFHNGKNILELLYEIYARTDEITNERAKVIINALFNCASSFVSEIEETRIISSISSEVELIIRNIALQIFETERFSFFKEVIDYASIDVLQTYARFLNTTGLAYGRFSKNGEEHSYNKVVSFEEFMELENAFTARAKELATECNLLSAKYSNLIFYMLERLDADFTAEYLSGAFTHEENIILFARHSLITLRSNEILFEIGDGYKKYFSDDKLMAAIDHCINAASILELPSDAQNFAAAFVLVSEGKTNYRGEVSKREVLALVQKWEERFAKK